MKRLLAVAAASCAAVLAAGGVARAVDAPATPAPAVAVARGVAPAPDPALARFYGQHLDWAACGSDECATLTVPVDYAHPDGETIGLALLRARATGTRRGSLVINPGGPGYSGVDFARVGRAHLGPAVAGAYDIVGFDPRGVGASRPLVCLDGAGADALLAADPTPDTPQERAATVERGRAFGAACEKAAPGLVRHLSTTDVARDLDVLRAALGDERLDYFGASYGTYLGARYAELFPRRVGRMVLDGAMDPSFTGGQRTASVAAGLERAITAFATDCAARSCPLGTSADDILDKVRELLRTADATPLPTHGVGPAGGLTEGWAYTAIASTLYDKGMWPSLESGLEYGFRGDGTVLMMIAVQAAERRDDGTYASNAGQVITAVNCLDRVAPSNPSAYERRQRDYATRWPVMGPGMAWEDAACGTWPGRPTAEHRPRFVPGTAPVVVIGTTRDPATPYEQAVSLARQLPDGRLITRDGDGHTGYHRGSRCVDDAVVAYLVDGSVPARDTRCAQDGPTPTPDPSTTAAPTSTPQPDPTSTPSPTVPAPAPTASPAGLPGARPVLPVALP